MKLLLGTFLLLVLVKLLNISYPISIVTTTRSGELSVVGEASLEAVPDIANVEASISVVNGRSTEEVQGKINSINNTILNEVKKLGIAKEDVRTSNYSIYPEREYATELKEAGIGGYTGNAYISIKVRNINNIPTLLNALTKAGANQIQGVRYSIEKPEKYREQVRNMAIANAKEQAQKLSKALGIRLGRITNIIESNTGGNPVPYFADKATGMSVGGVPEINVEPGTQTVSSTVTLFFEK